MEMNEKKDHWGFHFHLHITIESAKGDSWIDDILLQLKAISSH